MLKKIPSIHLWLGFALWGLLAAPSFGGAQEPRAEFLLVKQDHRISRDGQEGVLITVNSRLENVRDKRIRFSAFFDCNNRPLKAKGPRFRTPDGSLSIQGVEQPKYDVTTLTGVQLFLPYDEIDLLPRSTNEVKFFVEIQLHLDDGKTKMLATSSDFYFNFPPTAAAPPPTVSGVLGRWKGTEDLKGYGDLSMELEANGVSFMTDKDGRRQGTWVQTGNELTLTFYNGTVVYRGNLSGSALAGEATSGNMKWAWRVNREGGPPVPPPVVATGPIGRWTGTEDLKGYGNLVMEIEANGVSFMTDKDGRRQGTWTQSGSDLTLTFYNGTVVYRGALAGNAMAGDATSGNMKWAWRVNRESTAQPPSPAPIPTPGPTPTPPVIAGLSGRWPGTETLKGYGDLVMEFDANGAAFMTDKDGRRQGTWSQSGNEVTLTFYNGSVVYRGTVAGNAITGAATSGNMRWDWRIAREGPAPTPVPSPSPFPSPTPPSPAPPVPAPTAGLTGRWPGTEDLKGYGELVMELQANGVVFMTDKDGRREGKWSQQGNEVSLRFYNDTVVYTGTVSGNSISGSATNGQIRWAWRIARGEQAAPPTPAPPPMPFPAPPPAPRPIPGFDEGPR